jgi:hypothetical protein
MAAKSAPPCDEKIAQATLLYDSGVTPIGEILDLLGMSVGQFRRFREIHGWPLCASACAPKKPQEAALAAKKPRDAGRLIAARRRRRTGIRPRRSCARQTCAQDHRGERPHARKPRQDARRIEAHATRERG